MAHYSLLMLDHAGEVVSSGTCGADTDEAAMAAAGMWLGRHPAVEVWRGPHLVATLVSAGAAAPPESTAGSMIWKLGNRPWP